MTRVLVGLAPCSPCPWPCACPCCRPQDRPHCVLALQGPASIPAPVPLLPPVPLRVPPGLTLQRRLPLVAPASSRWSCCSGPGRCCACRWPARVVVVPALGLGLGLGPGHCCHQLVLLPIVLTITCHGCCWRWGRGWGWSWQLVGDGWLCSTCCCCCICCTCWRRHRCCRNHSCCCCSCCWRCWGCTWQAQLPAAPCRALLQEHRRSLRCSALLLPLLLPALPAGGPPVPDQPGLVVRAAVQAQLLQRHQAGQQPYQLLYGGGVPGAALVCRGAAAEELLVSGAGGQWVPACSVRCCAWCVASATSPVSLPALPEAHKVRPHRQARHQRNHHSHHQPPRQAARLTNGRAQAELLQRGLAGASGQQPEQRHEAVRVQVCREEGQRWCVSSRACCMLQGMIHLLRV